MKILAVLLGFLVTSSAFADDATVAERVTCADIQASITELSAIEEPDEEVIDELTKLKADYRRSCQRTGRGRKSSASSRVVVEAEAAPVEKQDVTEQAQQVAEENSPKDEEKKTAAEENKKVNKTAPEETEDVVEDSDAVKEVKEKPEKPEEEVVEQSGGAEETSEKSKENSEMSEEDEVETIKENLEAGLCADGTQPNKYGCCGDELFKDMGNATFACCPKNGGDCFPPIK